MKLPEEFFHIPSILLKDQKIFPFHIFVFNPQSNNYTAFLMANSPMTQENEDFLKFIEARGGELAIDKRQKRTFLAATDLTEQDVPSLKERELTSIEIKRNEKLKALERENIEIEGSEGSTDVKNVYDLQTGINSCIQSNNFYPMIEAAKKEIEIFEVNISHTVSLASYLAEQLMTEDNFTNRVVAICYFMAKNMDMKDQETLADIVCASFFAHLGYTQLDYTYSHMPENEMPDTVKNKIKKHPGYSHHLLLKSGIEISERCKNIIFQHHERYDGSGYPRQKHSEFIDILALILGAVTHVLEYSSGKITGSPVPFQSVIHRIKNKVFTTGLEFEFGDKILENLINLINLDNIGETA